MSKRNRVKHKLRECPYCKRSFGNVKNHILMFHKTEAEKQPAISLTKEDLLGQRKGPEESPADGTKGGAGPLSAYHCTNCGANLRKGENPCHQCGERLVWEGIE